MRSRQNIEKLIKNAPIRSNPDVSQAVLRDLLKQIDDAETQKPPGTLPNIGRTIMRSPFTKLAIAASFIVACVIGLSLWTGTQSGIALADVLARVEQAKAWRNKGSYTGTEQLPSGELRRIETRYSGLTSREYGYRSHDQRPDPNGGWMPGRELYLSPQKKTFIGISLAEKRYMRVKWDDAEAQQQQRDLIQWSEPSAYLKGIMACKYERIGRSTIDGIDVEGFRTTDPNCHLPGRAYVFKDPRVEVKVWVDVKTRLPVRYESLTSGLNERGNPITHRFVDHDFQWDVPVTAADFDPPPVPEGYTVVDLPVVLDEKAAIEGLRQCIKLFGSYITISESERPALIALSALEKSQTPAAVRLKDEMKGLTEEEKISRVRNAAKSVIQFILLHRGLVRDRKDPAYYGKTVTPKDADKALMRWKVSDNEYRVIFGDLHAETVSSEKLAELEAALPN